ncbi:hypothetical protein SK128_012607 [Halocaridina rubra]|uniref:Methyltransferase FkbM domain-containing protein n=1 Tax=Halocaridina rubra TaxID=373956 RepID=A0AAN8XB27_HALRR
MGLLIEPNPTTFTALLNKNRKAYSVNTALAVTPEAAEVTLGLRGRSGILSVLRDRGIRVKALPVYSLLRALGVTVVDFLSLDVESSEVKVLKTIPWDEVKFRLMCIEYQTSPEGFEYMKNLLTSNGYSFLGVTKIDAWFGLPELLSKDLNISNTE